MCCSYQQTGYQIGQNITTSLAQDNCTKYSLICVQGVGGDPLIEMKVESEECFKYASQESLDAHSNYTRESFDVLSNEVNVVKATLEKVLNNTGKSLGFDLYE